MTLLTVMIGGALGSALRYALSTAMNSSPAAGMPWGTLIANVGGCLLIGWLSSALVDASQPVRLGILVGLLGGFTTFSSFGLESLRLIQSGQTSTAVAYVLMSNAAGLVAVWIGHRMAGH
jgi:CrcB protein